mmetsp:Transcript_16726/g.23073  ORF Transcript_16726/g.23073 Transcript_16726/m.23073 type:complete len:103 (-) Transcript_16726:51-359(-)
MAGRIASSLITALGSTHLTQLLIQRSYRQYEDRAVMLAQNTSEWNKMHHVILERLQNSPLFDLEHYVRNLELLWKTMWEIHAVGLPPRPIKLELSYQGNSTK